MRASEASGPRQFVAALLFLGIVVGVAAAGSVANAPHIDGWYADAEKVPWSPPNAVFGPVWSVLYLLIAAAGWLIWRVGYRRASSNAARGALALYVVQLVLNALWSPAFFAGYPLLGPVGWWIAAVVILLLLGCVVGFAVAAARWSKAAAWFMVPYLLWLAFAATLNVGIIVLN